MIKPAMTNGEERRIAYSPKKCLVGANPMRKQTGSLCGTPIHIARVVIYPIAGKRKRGVMAEGAETE
jgi:hypothetical protein